MYNVRCIGIAFLSAQYKNNFGQYLGVFGCGVTLDNFSQLIPRSCAATLDKGQSTEIIPSKVFDGVKRSCGVILDNSEDITDSKIDAEIMWDDFGKS